MGGTNTTLSIVVKLIDEASSAMQDVGSKLTSIGSSMTSVGSTLSTNVSLPLIGIGTIATKAASDFQAAMTMLVTQAGLPADQLQKLTQQVQAFADSGAQQAPEELAKGLYHIVSLGVPAADAINVLKLASEGAAMSGANLEDVANALGAAVASNIKGSGDYQNAMAVLNATVGAGNMRMQDLATSLGNVLPQATTAGLSLTDVGAAMATMTDNGMPAADAATRLHMAIALMAAPTKQATDALASIGITQLQLADDMRNKGFLPALQDLHDHLVDTGLTANQQGQILSEAFGGGRSAGAIELLLNNLDRVQQKYQLIDQGVNSFSADVQQQSQTTAAQFAEAQAQMSDAAIKLGAAILPLISDVMPKLVYAVTSLVTWFTNLSKPIQDGVLIFLALFAAAGPVLIVLGSMITVVGTLTTAFSAIGPIILGTGALIAGLGAPLLIVIAAVALLAVLVYTHWNEIVGWTSDMMLRVSGTWQAGWNSAASFFTAAWKTIESVLETALKAVEGTLAAAFDVMRNIVTTEIDLIVGILILQLNALDPQWRKQWQALVTFVEALWNSLSAFFDATWTSIRVSAASAVAQAVSSIKGPLTELAAWWQSTWASFSSVFQAVWTDIEGFASKAVDTIIGYFDKLSSAIESVMSKIAGPLQALGSFAGGALAAAGNALGGAFNLAVGTGGQATGLNTYAIPHFASGGIVTGPTVGLIGEAGPEAIIPLSKLNSMSGSGITVNVTGNNISSQLDIRNLAQQVGAEIVRVLRLNQKLSI